jgi:hypothetical protein
MKWIRELLAPKPARTQPKLLPRGEWQDIDQTLKRAVEKFGWAARGLHAEDSASVLAELAFDLEREAEALAFRAHLYSQRADPATATGEKPKPRPESPPGDAQAETEEEREAKEERKRAAAEARRQKEAKEAARPPADLVLSAADSVETAAGKLDAAEGDPAVEGFRMEIDVLAEMALNLRRQLARAEVGTGAAR